MTNKKKRKQILSCNLVSVETKPTQWLECRSWMFKEGYLLGYGQSIQLDWNINAAEFKNFYPLTHQGSHAFHKNRRKGKRNLPLADRFVKPSKSASWFVGIFKGAAFLKSDHPLQVSTHEQIINDLLNASLGSSSQNEIRVFLSLCFGWFSL